ncbi:MAG TPA: hypothetical protein VGR26_02130 [Acidimicrobiales bacterium]|nr:hypothetical protein [Acidimicrobiales bacterium]
MTTEREVRTRHIGKAATGPPALADRGRRRGAHRQLAWEDGGVDKGHKWHVVELRFADFTVELCDGTAKVVDRHPVYWVESVASPRQRYARVAGLATESRRFRPFLRPALVPFSTAYPCCSNRRCAASRMVRRIAAVRVPSSAPRRCRARSPCPAKAALLR